MEPRAFLPVSPGGTSGGRGWDFSVEYDILSIDCTWGPLRWSPRLFTSDIHPCVIKDFEWICRQVNPLGVSKQGTTGSS